MQLPLCRKTQNTFEGLGFRGCLNQPLLSSFADQIGEVFLSAS